ncbi:MAG: hypothetical protein AAF517_23380 [Planctomycetota bacterium]
MSSHDDARVPGSEGNDSEAKEPESLVDRGVDAALYGLSLPERVARGMVGCASGVLKETAELAVPKAMKSSRMYDMTVQKMLGFLIDDVGKLKTGSQEGETPDDYLAKKAVGNVVDVAGLAVLHVSPLWVLAIFSDVAQGTKTYVNALADELKREGIVEESATIESLDHLLTRLESTSGVLADRLDTPPITVEELKKSVEQLREESKRVDLKKAIPNEDLEAIWNEIKETANTENRTVLEVSNAVAMMTFNQVTRAGKGAVTSVKVGLDLVNDNVLSYYRGALSEIHEKGYYQSVLDAYEPYVNGLKHLFSDDTETTTEDVLRGRPFVRLWRWVTSRFRGSDPAGEKSAN